MSIEPDTNQQLRYAAHPTASFRNPLKTPINNPKPTHNAYIPPPSHCLPVKIQRKLPCHYPLTPSFLNKTEIPPIPTQTFPQIQLKYLLQSRGTLDILVKSPQARVKRRDGSSESERLKIRSACKNEAVLID
jgi:hypothetical protein